jgi:hypothetical protein
LPGIIIAFFSSVDYQNQNGFKTQLFGNRTVPANKEHTELYPTEEPPGKYLIKNYNSFLIGKLYSWEKMVPLNGRVIEAHLLIYYL